jgi:hypothetical protein
MANDYFASKGWLTKYAQAEDSRGMWQKYVAEVQRSEMDNFNTPDLDQGADSILRPGETLEDDFDVSFRRPNAEGGFQQLVRNTNDGSRPGYAGALTAKQQQKIIDAFPDTVFDFDTYPMSGAKKYLTSDQNKANPDHTKVERFKKKGFTLEMGKGLNTRGVPYSKEGKRLSIKDQNKIKAKYDLPEGIKEWDFKTYKYGIKSGGRENLLSRMARTIAEKGQWTLAADFGGPKGWMMAQMQRVFKNESKNPNIKKLTYKPVYAEINGQDRIVGFKDNTVAGKGKTYYGLAKYTKKNAGDWTQHGDWKLNKKLIDISKRSKNAPNEVITGILNDKGFKGKITLNNLIHFLSGTEEGSLANVKNAIVRHHNSGVKFGSATNDITLTTSVINKRIVEAETRIAAGNILPEDVQLLKNNNVYVRGANDKLYGAGKKSPIGQYKQIQKSVADALESNVDFKGNKFKTKELNNYLQRLKKDLVALCPRGGNSSGGRIGFNLGSGAACGAKFLEARLKDGKGLPVQRRLMADIIATGAGIKNFAKNMLNPLELLNPKNLIGPQAIALMGAFEVGDVTYDVINNNKPITEALGDNWILKYASPYNQEEEQVKAVQAKNISGSPAMQTYMKKVKLQAEFERENKKLEKLKKDTPSKNNPKVQEQIKEQQTVVDNLKNNWQQFVINSTVDVNGEQVLTLESGKQDFEKAFGQVIDKRQGGEFVAGDEKQSLMKTYMEGKSEDKYINTAADWIDQGDPLSYKYKKDLGKDQGRNLSETEREAEKLFPFETGSIKADYTPSTYKNLNYTPQKLPAEIRQEYENLATKQGILPPRTSLSQTPMRDGSTYDYLKDLTELYNNSQKAKQASMYPGYGGTQEPAKYAEGGLANLMKKYYDKR